MTMYYIKIKENILSWFSGALGDYCDPDKSKGTDLYYCIDLKSIDAFERMLSISAHKFIKPEFNAKNNLKFYKRYSIYNKISSDRYNHLYGGDSKFVEILDSINHTWKFEYIAEIEIYSKPPPDINCKNKYKEITKSELFSKMIYFGKNNDNKNTIELDKLKFMVFDIFNKKYQSVLNMLQYKVKKDLTLIRQYILMQEGIKKIDWSDEFAPLFFYIKMSKIIRDPQRGMLTMKPRLSVWKPSEDEHNKTMNLFNKIDNGV